MSQRAICRNLSYNLQQMKVSEDRTGYTAVVDSVVCGPCTLKDTEVDLCLAIPSQEFRRSWSRRTQMVGRGKVPDYGNSDSEGREQRLHFSKQEERGGYSALHTRREREQETVRRRQPFLLDQEPEREKYSCPDLHGQFQLFAKFGESGAAGTKITLSQSDRWLRQAKVIDGWTVTTIDTAIAFRKISKGSIWLDFKLWRSFLEYVAKQKDLNLSHMIDKLEMCGKPNINSCSRTKQLQGEL